MEGKKFVVLTNTVFEGWKSHWTETVYGVERPLLFDTREEAQAEIDDIVRIMRHDPEDYRIEEVG